MRISTPQLFTQNLSAILDNQARLARSQEQISTGKRILSPSDDPVNSVRATELRRAMEQTAQFLRNAEQGRNRLSLEENAVTGAINVLQRIRDLAVQANSAIQSNETRTAIATEVRQHMDSLLEYANTRDSNGHYLFAGFQEGVQAFSASGGVVTYNGDDGQRLLQTGPSRRVADSDPGSLVFGAVRDGNGTFSTAGASTNTGTGVIDGGAVVDPSQYDGGSYTVRFTAPGTYEVLDSTAAVIAGGSFQSGDSIGFQGISLGIDGQPATGDEFTVAPSQRRDVFAMVEALAQTLATPRSNPAARALQINDINSALDNITRALDHLTDVRTSVGARLQSVDQQVDINEGASLQFQTTLSTIEDADLPAVISRFNQQLLGLQATQQAFAKVQGLSLFNFL